MKTAGISMNNKDRRWRDGPLFMLFVLYGLFWLVLAVNPLDRRDWLLENLLVFAVVPMLVLGWRRFRFSTGSYVLIVFFLALHAYGAHYTYAKTPLGDWLRDGFDLERNYYDRLVHFAFGVSFAPPVFEWLTRRVQLCTRIGASFAVCVVLAASAVYEILEAGVAGLVNPELGAAYTGTQGDEWDAQKDMALALFGAALIVAGIAVRRRSGEGRGNQPTDPG